MADRVRLPEVPAASARDQIREGLAGCGFQSRLSRQALRERRLGDGLGSAVGRVALDHERVEEVLAGGHLMLPFACSPRHFVTPSK